MAVIHHNIDLDVNSNCYKDSKDGYWSQNGMGIGPMVDTESSEMAGTVRAVALRLEGSLRAAKKAHLSCGEVLLPLDLLTRVARDIIRMAETEPCGIRGCLILLNFESGSPPSPSSSSSNNFIHSSSPPVNNFHLNSSTTTTTNTTNTTNITTSTNTNNTNSIVSSSPSPSPGVNRRKIGKVRCDSQTVTTFELHLTLKEDLAPWYNRLPQILRNLTKGGTIVVSPSYTIAKKKLYRSH